MPHLHPILCLFAALFIAACNTPNPGETDPDASDPKKDKFIPYQERLARQEKELRTRLKVRETTTLASAQGNPAGFIVVRTETFDANGNLVSGRDYDPQSGGQQGGQLKKSVDNTWKGDLLMHSEVKNAAGQSYRASYTYNEAGDKLSEVIRQPNGDTLLARSYVYDELGNETEARLVDSQRHRSLRKTMTYDARSRPLSIREYEGDSLTWEEVYDIREELWHVTRKNHHGRVMGIFTTEFDEDGKALRIEQMGGDSTLRLGIRFTYNEEGKLIREVHYGREDRELQSIDYRYFPNGLLRERVLNAPSAPAGIVTKWQYQFGK